MYNVKRGGERKGLLVYHLKMNLRLFCPCHPEKCNAHVLRGGKRCGFAEDDNLCLEGFFEVEERFEGVSPRPL